MCRGDEKKHISAVRQQQRDTPTPLCPWQVNANRLTSLSLYSILTHFSHLNLDIFYSTGMIGPVRAFTVGQLFAIIHRYTVNQTANSKYHSNQPLFIQ